MTERAALLQLRDRLRAATGPDYALSGDIALDVAGWRVKDGGLWWRDPISKEWVMGPPHYTASIDAAVTLAPEGWHPELIRNGDGWHAKIWHPRTLETYMNGVGCYRSADGKSLDMDEYIKRLKEAPNGALALCLAWVEYELAKTEPL